MDEASIVQEAFRISVGKLEDESLKGFLIKNMMTCLKWIRTHGHANFPIAKVGESWLWVNRAARRKRRKKQRPFQRHPWRKFDKEV